MARVLVLVGVVFFMLFEFVEYIHYILKVNKSVWDSDEYKYYYWRTLKRLTKEVDEEIKMKKIKEVCWYCEYVVVDMWGDGSHHCKKKRGQWVSADSTCDEFKPKEVRSEGGEL